MANKRNGRTGQRPENWRNMKIIDPFIRDERGNAIGRKQPKPKVVPQVREEPPGVSYDTREMQPVRKAVERMSEDDALDMLVELDSAFKGFGTPEAAPIGPAMEKVIAVTDEYRRLNEQMISAGVKPSKIEGLRELQLRNLRGGVPAPYIKGPKDREVRVHTRREPNAITGRNEVVPFMDPSNPTEPLVTTFERRPDLKPPGFGGEDVSALELVQLQALKLAGMDAGLYGAGGAPHHYADFAVKGRDGSIKKVEGMMVNRGIDNRGNSYNENTPIPSYTSLVDATDPNFTQQSIAQKVRRRANKLETTDYIAAVEDLVRDGTLKSDNRGNATQHRFGKLMRSELENLGGDKNAVYDAMVIAGMNETPEGDRRFEQRMYPPDTLQYIPDLKATKDAVRDSSYGIFGVKDTENRGATGTGHRRGKLLHRIPANHPTINDLTRIAPHTAQLLRILPYI